MKCVTLSLPACVGETFTELIQGGSGGCRFCVAAPFDCEMQVSGSPVMATDVANFDPTFTNEAAYDSVVDTSQLSEKMKGTFQGFTYEDTSVLAAQQPVSIS